MTDNAIDKALFIAKKLFAELVFDVQALESMPFTFPEVQTFIQGITVGGHRISDEEKLKQQMLGWQLVIEMVEKRQFVFSKNTACAIQAVLAKDEALVTGAFRTGAVGIAGTDHTPPPADELDAVFASLLDELAACPDIRTRAYLLHLRFARNQFFFDGNKRTGLLTAGGLLMSEGIPPFSIPAGRVHEYNAGMIEYYNTGNASNMLAFLDSCHRMILDKFGWPMES